MKTLITKGSWIVKYKEVDNGYNIYFMFKRKKHISCEDSGYYKTFEEAKKEAIAFLDYYNAL